MSVWTRYIDWRDGQERRHKPAPWSSLSLAILLLAGGIALIVMGLMSPGSWWLTGLGILWLITAPFHLLRFDWSGGGHWVDSPCDR